MRPEDINDQTIVPIGTRRDTVAAFKIMGQLPSDLSQAPREAPSEPLVTPEEGPKQDPADTITFPDEIEANANALVQELGEGGAMGVLDAVSQGRFDLVDKIIGTMGSEPGVIAQQVREVTAQYTEAARQVLGASEADMQGFTEYCNLKAQRERSDVTKEFMLQQSTKGLKALFAKYKSEGSTALATDETVYRAAIAQGIPASRTDNGTTILELPQGSMSWREALARGYISF